LYLIFSQTARSSKLYTTNDTYTSWELVNDFGDNIVRVHGGKNHIMVMTDRGSSKDVYVASLADLQFEKKLDTISDNYSYTTVL
jgi:hypothetical protein